jgi:hypothetical protein
MIFLRGILYYTTLKRMYPKIKQLYFTFNQIFLKISNNAVKGYFDLGRIIAKNTEI